MSVSVVHLPQDPTALPRRSEHRTSSTHHRHLRTSSSHPPFPLGSRQRPSSSARLPCRPPSPLEVDKRHGLWHSRPHQRFSSSNKCRVSPSEAEHRTSRCRCPSLRHLSCQHHRRSSTATCVWATTPMEAMAAVQLKTPMPRRQHRGASASETETQLLLAGARSGFGKDAPSFQQSYKTPKQQIKTHTRTLSALTGTFCLLPAPFLSLSPFPSPTLTASNAEFQAAHKTHNLTHFNKTNLSCGRNLDR